MVPPPSLFALEWTLRNLSKNFDFLRTISRLPSPNWSCAGVPAPRCRQVTGKEGLPSALYLREPSPDRLNHPIFPERLSCAASPFYRVIMTKWAPQCESHSMWLFGNTRHDNE